MAVGHLILAWPGTSLAADLSDERDQESAQACVDTAPGKPQRRGPPLAYWPPVSQSDNTVGHISALPG